MRIFSCFNRIGFRLGGVESYYIRMYKWAKIKQFNLFFFMEKGERIAKEWMTLFEKLNISIVYYNKLGAKIELQGESGDCLDDVSEGSMCITNSFDTFISANTIFHNLKNEMNIIFYVFHPYVTRLFNRKLLDGFWIKPILLDIMNYNLIFMDEETRDCASKYYQRVDFSTVKIIRLGMEVPAFNLEQRKKIYLKENFMVLTIARFDFPFKGYINGLIDTYLNLKKKFSNLELVIIGDGEGKADLEEKLRNISDDNIANGIHMLGYLPYDEIGKYIEQADVFVGMGTTILDAAKYGVPGIVATAYQMEDYAAGFFASDYTCIAKLVDEDEAKKYRIGELIKEIYEMSEHDYLKTCKRCHDFVEEYYGIDNCMVQVMETDGTKKVKPSFRICFFYNYLRPLWKKLKKIRINIDERK